MGRTRLRDGEITVSEAMDILSVSRQTVLRAVECGQLAGRRVSLSKKSRILISRESALKWAALRQFGDVKGQEAAR
jgi:hypothetical protein